MRAARRAAGPVKLTIPGEPCAQGRPRFSRYSFGRPLDIPRAIEPEKSRNWKSYAVGLMYQHRGSAAVRWPDGALEVLVVAVFSCPRSEWRKEPVARRRHVKRGDPDNIAKAVLDAGTAAGLWRDDAQVAVLKVEKWIAAQDEAPHVVVEVTPL